MIEIGKRITINDIEEFYQLLYTSHTEAKMDIRIPLELESTEFGIIPALIQFVSTWIRIGKNGNLRVPFENIEEQAESFINRDFSFPLIIMNWKYGIVNDSDNRDLRAKLKDYTAAINLKMRSLKGLTGNQLLLTCFDQFPAKTGLLNCFYSDNDFLEKEDALEFTLMPTLVHILSMSRQVLHQKLKDELDDIRGMIFELMKNTDEWARTDKDDKPLNPNIRGLYVKFTRGGKRNLTQRYNGNAIYGGFFDDLVPNANDEVYFLELSVFDSGPGFIDRKTRGQTAPSIEDSVMILKECLTLHNTSATGTRSLTKGLGLDRILNILNNKGILLIRTNQLSVYRNLKTRSHISGTETANIALYDWHTHSATDFTVMKDSKGAVLSIIYPLS